MRGGDFIGDLAIRRAEQEALDWQKLYYETLAERDALNRQVSVLEEAAHNYGSANAINVVLRFALANQLAIVDPYNPMLNEAHVWEFLKKKAQSLYDAGASFDDLRIMANSFSPDGEGMNREKFIKYARIGHFWEALHARTWANDPPQLETSQLSRAYLEKLPALLLEMTGDVEHPVFSSDAEKYMVEEAGEEFDRLVKEDYFRNNPSALPVRVAMSFGRKRGHSYILSKLDHWGLKDQNKKYGYRPPEDLFDAYPEPKSQPAPAKVAAVAPVAPIPSAPVAVMGVPRLDAVAKASPAMASAPLLKPAKDGADWGEVLDPTDPFAS